MKKVLSILLSVLLIAGSIIPTTLVYAEEGELKPYYQNGYLYYEATAGSTSGDAATVYSDWEGYTIDGCSYNSCVILQGGSVTLDIDVPYKGYYNIGVSGSTFNANEDTYCSVWINNGSEYFYRANHEDFCKWPVVGVSSYDYGTGSFVPCGGFLLNAGKNTVSLKTNNGYMYVDRLAISVASVNIPDDDPIAIVNNAIENLPEVLNNDNYKDVARVKESYDALNDFQKSLIKGENYTKLLKKVEEAKAFELIGHEVFNDDGYSYQAESAILDKATVENNIEATGNKFININNGTATFKFKVPYDGYYKVNFAVSTFNDTTDTSAKVMVGNSEYEYYVTANHENNGSWKLSCLNSYNYEENKYVPVEGGFYFSSTKENTIVLSGLNEGMLFDRMVLVPDSLTYPENDPAGLVFNKIQSLPEELSIENKAAVQAAKSGFDDLDATGRVAVINVEKLNTAFDNMINLNVINSSEFDGSYVYEAENAMYTDRAYVADDPDASAGKYINIAYGTLYMNINVPAAGKYNLKIFGSTNDENTSKCDYVSVNGEDIYLVAYPKTSFGSWTECEPGFENWVDDEIKLNPAGSIELNKGENLVVIRANWGKTNYDKLVLVPVTVKGDVDGNGVLEADDMSALIKHIIGVDEAVAPDVNNDGEVNIVDAVVLKKILISL